MNIEIKPFIHQIRFTPQMVQRPLKERNRRADIMPSCLVAGPVPENKSRDGCSRQIFLA